MLRSAPVDITGIVVSTAIMFAIEAVANPSIIRAFEKVRLETATA